MSLLYVCYLVQTHCNSFNILELYLLQQIMSLGAECFADVLKC